MKNIGKNSLLLTVLLALGLMTGCSGNNPDSVGGSSSQTAPSSEVTSSDAQSSDTPSSSAESSQTSSEIDSSIPQSSDKPSSSVESSQTSSEITSSSVESSQDSSSEAPFAATLTFVGDEGVAGTFQVGGEEVTSAQEGETVILRLKVASGYVLDGEPTATGATLTKFAGNYTFTVGTENVTVTAKSRKLEAHTINVQADQGAHVALTVENNEATEAISGDQVTVSLSFDNKYSFVSISADSAEVELITVESGKTYSFMMPDAEVTLIVHAKYNPENYKVSNLVIVDQDHISSVETTVEEGASALEGSQVLFRFTGDNSLNYGVDIFAAGSTAESDRVQTEMKVQQVNDDDTTTYAVTFTMPDTNIDIYLYSEAKTVAEGVTVTLPQNDHVHFYGLTSGEKYAAEDATLFVLPDNGYLLKEISYKADDGEEQTLALTDGKVTLPLSEATSTFEVFVNPQETGVASISKAEGSLFSIEGNTTDVTIGSDVRLTLRADSGFAITSVSVATESGAEVEYKYDSNSTVLTFTMPNENVVISAETVSYFELSYEPTAGISDVHYTLSGLDSQTAVTGATVGTSVLIWFHVDTTNYRLDSVYVGETKIAQDPSIYSNGQNCAYLYTMNANDKGQIKFNLTARHGVTLAESEDYSILNAPATRPAEGENISFRLRPAVGKTIKSVTADTAEVEAGDGLGWYHFTMPTSDVALTVETEACQTTDFTADASAAASWSLTDAYGVDVTNQTEFNVGDTLTFHYTQKHGFVNYQVSATGASLQEAGADTYSFTVGTDPVSLTVTAEEETSHSINLSESLDGIASFSFTDGGVAGSKAYVGHTIVATLNVTAENTTFNADAAATVTGATDAKTTVSADGLSATVTFTMPDSDVDIDLAFTTIATQENTVDVQWNLDNMSSDYARETFKNGFFVQSEQIGNPAEIKIPWGSVYESTKEVYFAIPSSYSISGYPVVTVINQTTGEYITATDGTVLDHYKITNSFSCPHFIMPDAPILIIAEFEPFSY